MRGNKKARNSHAKSLLMIKIIVTVKLREYIVSQLCKITKIYELATDACRAIQEKDKN